MEKIFEENEYFELKDTLLDFTNFLKEKYPEYEKKHFKTLITKCITCN